MFFNLTLPSISQHQVCGSVPFKGWTSTSLRGPLPKTLVFYQLNYSFSCFAALVQLHNQKNATQESYTDTKWYSIDLQTNVSWSSPDIMVQVALSAVLPPFTWISLTCAFFWPITLPTWRWDFPMFGWCEWEYNLWLQDRTCQSGYMYITIYILIYNITILLTTYLTMKTTVATVTLTVTVRARPRPRPPATTTTAAASANTSTSASTNASTNTKFHKYQLYSTICTHIMNV